jgi:hypothetical protein
MIMANRRIVNRHIVALSAMALLISAAPAPGQTPRRASADGGELNTLLQATARLVTPAVVEVLVTAYLPGEPVVSRASDLVITQRGSGSGVIVDRDFRCSDLVLFAPASASTCCVRALASAICPAGRRVAPTPGRRARRAAVQCGALHLDVPLPNLVNRRVDDELEDERCEDAANQGTPTNRLRISSASARTPSRDVSRAFCRSWRPTIGPTRR